MKSARYFFLLFPVLALVSGSWFGLRAFQSRPSDAPRITTSPTTTIWTEPLDEEGYVDFLAGINQRESGRVKPDQNTALKLVSLFGPECLVDTNDEDDVYPVEFVNAANSLEENERFVSMSVSDIDWSTLVLEAIVSNREDPQSSVEDLKNRFFMQVWAEKNEQVLQAVIEAIRLPEFYFPASDIESLQPVGGIEFRFIVKCGEVAELIKYRGQQLTAEGKIDQALEYSVLLRRLANKLRNGLGGSMRIASSEIHQRVKVLEQTVLNSRKVTPKQLREYCQTLHSLRNESVSQRLDQVVRFEMLDTVIDEIVRDKDSVHSGSRRNSYGRRGRRHFYLFRKLSVNLDETFKQLNYRIDQMHALIDRRSAKEIIADLENIPIVKRIDPQSIIWADEHQRGKLLGEYYANLARRKAKYLLMQEKFRWATDNLGILAFHIKAESLEGVTRRADLPHEIFQENRSPLDGQPAIYQRRGNGYQLTYEVPYGFNMEVPMVEFRF